MTTTSPAALLAASIGGDLQQSGAITVGPHIVSCSPIGGVVRVNGERIGTWQEPTEVLAAAFFAAVGKRVAS